jgi:hypothetical protein
MKPKQWSRRFPIIEGIAFDEPQGGTFVMSIARSVVIYRRIRGREPTSKLLSRLIPYEID